MKFVLRSATNEDIQGLSDCYVRSMHETYSAIYPWPVVNEINPKKAHNKWRDEFAEQIADADRAIFIIESEEEEIVGFVTCGAARIRSQKALGQGEIFSLHIESDHQGYGLGKALMLACARFMISRGLFSGGAWIAEENGIGRRFCEDLGGRLTGRRRQNMRGFPIEMVGFSWSDFGDVAQLESTVPDWGGFGG